MVIEGPKSDDAHRFLFTSDVRFCPNSSLLFHTFQINTLTAFCLNYSSSSSPADHFQSIVLWWTRVNLNSIPPAYGLWLDCWDIVKFPTLKIFTWSSFELGGLELRVSLIFLSYVFHRCRYVVLSIVWQYSGHARGKSRWYIGTFDNTLYIAHLILYWYLHSGGIT